MDVEDEDGFVLGETVSVVDRSINGVIVGRRADGKVLVIQTFPDRSLVECSRDEIEWQAPWTSSRSVARSYGVCAEDMDQTFGVAKGGVTKVPPPRLTSS